MQETEILNYIVQCEKSVFGDFWDIDGLRKTLERDFCHTIVAYDGPDGLSIGEVCDVATNDVTEDGTADTEDGTATTENAAVADENMPTSETDESGMRPDSGCAEYAGELRPIGYLIYTNVQGEADIIRIAVDTAYRKHGIGSKLMEEMMANLRAERAEKLTLEVRLSNIAAQELYKKYGLKLIYVRKAYYHNPPEDAYIMQVVF